MHSASCDHRWSDGSDYAIHTMYAPVIPYVSPGAAANDTVLAIQVHLVMMGERIQQWVRNVFQANNAALRGEIGHGVLDVRRHSLLVIHVIGV